MRRYETFNEQRMYKFVRDITYIYNANAYLPVHRGTI
jgi:hypothetical protein